MAHELARPFQQALGVGNFGAAKEPDVDVSGEHVDVREGHVAETGDRAAIVHQFAHFVAAPAHGVAQILDEAVSRRLAAGYSAYLGRGGQHRTFVAGVQDLSTRVPMRPDTIFRVASITKPVVAAAAMILVDE